MKTSLLWSALAAAQINNDVTVEVGQNATLRCSNDQAVEQTVYVDFQALDDASESTVLEFDRSATGQIEIKYHPSNRFITDGRSIQLFNAQLSDEGTYTCTIRPTGSNKVTIRNPLVVNTKPSEPEIVNEVPQSRPLIDIYDDETQDKDTLSSVATCKVDGAKPPAKVTWHFENQENEVGDVIPSSQQVGYKERQTQTSSTLQIIPVKSYDKQSAVCRVTWNGSVLYTKSFTIDVQYKPHTPIIRPNKAQQKATCTAEGNPEPDIVWTLPDGTTDSNPTVLMQEVGNPNATYTCMAQNDHGKSLLETTNWDLDQFVGPVSTGNIGLIVGVVAGAIAIICLAGYLIYRFCLDPTMAEKQPEYDYHGGQRDHYVGGSQTGLNSAPQRKTPDYEPEYDTDDEPGQIVSQTSSRYHQTRRSNSNIRSTPQRNVQYDGAPADVDLVDNAKDRYETDYNPSYYARNTVPYKDTYMSMDNGYDGSDSQMV